MNLASIEFTDAELRFIRRRLLESGDSLRSLQARGPALIRALINTSMPTWYTQRLLFAGRQNEAGSAITRCFRLLRGLRSSNYVLKIHRGQELCENVTSKVLFMGFTTEPVFPFSVRQLLENDAEDDAALHLPPKVRSYVLREACECAAQVHWSIREPHCVMLDDMFITESYQIVWDGGFFRAVDLEGRSIRELRRLALPSPPMPMFGRPVLDAVGGQAASGAGEDPAPPAELGTRKDLRDALQTMVDAVPALPASWIVGDGLEFPLGMQIPVRRMTPVVLPLPE